MIEKLLPLQFIKKSPFYGSCQGMRYRLRRQEEELEVCIYPEPFAFDATPEEKKRLARALKETAASIGVASFTVSVSVRLK